MKLKWLGHASFLLTSDSGTRIVTDPFKTGGPLSYAEINETADAVTLSHTHNDHNNPEAVKGNPKIIKAGPETVKDVKISGVTTHHDDAAGQKRGHNTAFCFDIDGLHVCHMGDLGHELSDKQASDLGKVDVLLLPVGGYYTIDAAAATRVIEHIKPRIAIPMHYKTSKCTYPIATADEFLKGKKNVRRTAGSEIEIKAGKLPMGTEIVVLEPAL